MRSARPWVATIRYPWPRQANRSSCRAPWSPARRRSRRAPTPRHEPGDAAEYAVRQEDDDNDEQEAKPKIPELRIHVGKLVARRHEDDRAEKPAIEPAGAAEDEHHQHFGRALKAQRIEGNELRRLRRQRAGDPGEGG